MLAQRDKPSDFIFPLRQHSAVVDSAILQSGGCRMGRVKESLDLIGRLQVAQSIWVFVKPLVLPVVLAAAAGGA
jgi:hypothetical protein